MQIKRRTGAVLHNLAASLRPVDTSAGAADGQLRKRDCPGRLQSMLPALVWWMVSVILGFLIAMLR
jgi:hypothetical protein